MKNIAIILFILTYALILIKPKYRSQIALTSAACFILFGIIPISEIGNLVDWNVIMMIDGTMGIVSLFIESKMPMLLADLILDRTPNVRWAIIALSLFAGIISAFVDNVATVLMIAPVAINIAKRLKISPVTSVIAIAVASNLQGAATLVGDTTSILLGGYANLNFMDFFFYKGRPGLFWVIQVSALAATLVLFYILRNNKEPIEPAPHTEIEDYFPTILLVGMVVLLITASFFPSAPKTINGIICMALLIIGLVRSYFKTKGTGLIKQTLSEIDYGTIVLLASLFVIVGGLIVTGVIDDISSLFIKFDGGSTFLVYSIIVWSSVLLSAFIDNIPYVATMLPVVASIAAALNMPPHLLYFGLLSGATLGGNLTPIGASANITALGILKKEGYEVKTKEFMRIGVPFTLVAVVVGYLLIWFFWA